LAREPSCSIVAYGANNDNDQEVELTRDEWLAAKQCVAEMRRKRQSHAASAPAVEPSPTRAPTASAAESATKSVSQGELETARVLHFLASR
jgi:hypothetical protein